jgi:hypothetical protein
VFHSATPQAKRLFASGFSTVSTQTLMRAYGWGGRQGGTLVKCYNSVIKVKPASVILRKCATGLDGLAGVQHEQRVSNADTGYQHPFWASPSPITNTQKHWKTNGAMVMIYTPL